MPSLLYFSEKGGDYMKGGFSFCGIDIADIGLEYAPENKDTYVYKPAEAEVHEELFDGHHGGYIYGATIRPKEFTLRCYYEDQHIAKGVMAQAYNLFKVGRSGKLVFERRPWCYYYATVTSVDTTDMYNYMNGLFVVTMKAYYPFARIIGEGDEMFCNELTDPYHNEIMKNTALLDDPDMILPTSFDYPDQSVFLLYNPGTECADVGIVLQGTAGDGIKITNLTNGQSCRYMEFNTGLDYEIYTDGINGKTILRPSNDMVHDEPSLAFLYHDYGFIKLDPAFPILRDLYVTYYGTTVESVKILYQEEEEKEWYKDKYIYLDTGWYKIQKCVDEHTLTLYDAAESGHIQTNIVLMNEIKVTASPNSSITKLAFIYKPTFA